MSMTHTCLQLDKWPDACVASHFVDIAIYGLLIYILVPILAQARARLMSPGDRCQR